MDSGTQELRSWSVKDYQPIPEFDLEEIRSAFQGLARRKAPGLDMITNEHLEHSIPALGDSWFELFKYCTSRARLPSQWRTSLLFLLFKGKGQKEDLNNYRGISLLNTSFKVFTKMLKDRLAALLESKLSDGQYGFRKGRSTLDAGDRLLGTVREAHANGFKGVYALFIDFQKAFDTVDRALLLKKLKYDYNLEDGYLAILEEILLETRITFRNQMCQCRDFHSSPIEVQQTIGVVQGDSLSPYLFALFINDLVNYVKSHCPGVETLLYADDAAAVTTSNREMKNVLLTLKEWSEQNKLKVNASKTKMMKFRNGGRLAKGDEFMYSDAPIEIVNEFVYLGITLQTKLGFTKHVERVKRKAITATALLTKHLSKLSLSSVLKLFKVKIKPIATYGIRLVAPSLSKASLLQLDIVKSKYLKKALCLPVSTNNDVVYNLCDTKRLCEELKEAGVQFDEQAYKEYQEVVQAKKLLESQRQRNKLAFEDDNWKRPMQPRHYVVGYTVHGFHWCICKNKEYHERKGECVCKECNQSAADADHLARCPMLQGDLYGRYKTVVGARSVIGDQSN